MAVSRTCGSAGACGTSDMEVMLSKGKPPQAGSSTTPPPPPVERKCGTCACWHRCVVQEDGTVLGECWLNPPTPVYALGSGRHSIRPVTKDTERCEQYRQQRS